MQHSWPSFLQVIIYFIALTHTNQSQQPPPPTFLLPQPVRLNPQDPSGVALLQVVVCSNGSVVAPDVVPGGVAFTPSEGIAEIPVDATAFFFYLRDVSGFTSGPLLVAEDSLVVRCRDPASGDESIPGSSSFIVTYGVPLLREDPSDFPISINTTEPNGRSIFQFNFELHTSPAPSVNVSLERTHQCCLLQLSACLIYD